MDLLGWEEKVVEGADVGSMTSTTTAASLMVMPSSTRSCLSVSKFRNTISPLSCVGSFI